MPRRLFFRSYIICIETAGVDTWRRSKQYPCEAKMNRAAAYDELLKRVREESLLASSAELLSWDEETYLPPEGVEYRSEQLAYLAGLQHAQATDPRRGELLSFLEASAPLGDASSAPAVNLRELRRRFERETRLPGRLVEELARVTTLAQQQWVQARATADFAAFRPRLEKVIGLKREEAEALGYEDSPYDALLEDYEPGARSRALADVFHALEREIIPLANTITHASPRQGASALEGSFPLDRQRNFALQVAGKLGFDLKRGRIDTTTHPFFSTLGPHDCRIATRYHPVRFGDGFFATLHEIGHGLYEQGLPVEHHGTPRGEAPSLSIHEAQARLWENLVGRSRGFWRHFFPMARQVFPESLGNVSLDRFHRDVNRVEAGCLRVGADEITYNLHIVIRFELEQALLSGDLPVADLPAAWDEAYRHRLGVIPAHAAEGCLQDGHWAVGMIGYFPTYTLGNLMAAQLFAAAQRDLGDLNDAFARGDFGGLVGWLGEKVYRHGSCYLAKDLVRRATGAPPDHRAFLDYLRGKYAATLPR